MQLTYITPESPEELMGHYETVRFLMAFLPKDVNFTAKELIQECAGFLTLVYSGKMPIGYFILYPVQGNSKKSVEIHGCYRQDLRILLGKEAAKAVMDHIFQKILSGVFVDAGKQKIVAKLSKQARLARIWVRRFGFEQVPNVEDGKTIWKLERNKYLGVVKV
jgi:hypothetical protein